MKNSVSTKNGKEYVHYMTIDMPDGSVKKGSVDYRPHASWLGIENSKNLEGARVLDIAANDGYWSFWSEKKKAKEVVAIDVDTYDQYDWGWDIPPEFMNQNSHFEKDSTFHYLASEFDSSVKRKKQSIYELNPENDGQFDLVFNFGLLYHLRHPAMAMDSVRKVCNGAHILRTHTVRRKDIKDLPINFFYEDNVFKAVTNWTGPTEACCVQWMKNSGFKHVFVEKLDSRHDDVGEIGQTFVGVANDDSPWLEDFKSGSKLQYCDAAYFENIKQKTLDVVDKKRAAAQSQNFLSPAKRIYRRLMS
jgi:tRNA (mo5U34)-methyltransferase